MKFSTGNVFGNPGLHVAGGWAISADFGLDASLTITAQVDPASLWLEGRAGSSPPLGAADQPVAPSTAPGSCDRRPLLRAVVSAHQR